MVTLKYIILVGAISSKGNYQRNKPVGQWEYFYESGLPERTIKFDGPDTLLIRFVDPKGNITVVDGNGEFNGVVAGLNGYNSVVAKGMIRNGKPDGKWSSKAGSTDYWKEEFDNGKFLKGDLPSSRVKSKYTDRSQLKTFFLSNYLYKLETYSVERCQDSSMYKLTANKYSFDMQKFSSILSDRLDRVISNDFSTGRTEDYTIGDHFLTIRIFLDPKGKAERFENLTAFGQQFYSAITNTIRSLAIFSPSQKTMYFHLKLKVTGSSANQIVFKFSPLLGNDL
jgi:hypothetical protein